MNPRNLILSLIVPVCLGLSSIACNDDKDLEYTQKVEFASGDFVVNVSEIAVKGAQSKTITIKSPSAPQISTNANWIHVGNVAASGTASIYTCELLIDDNDGYDSRQGEVIVTCGSSTHTITVSQYGNETVKLVSSASETLDPLGGNLTIKYAATSDVEIAAPNWLTRIDSRALVEDEVSYSYVANRGQEARTGNVTITLVADPTISVSIALSQAAAPKAETKSAAEIAKTLSAGINIGNTLEAIGGETAWGAAPINREYIHSLKAAGFNTVRIPVAWLTNGEMEQNGAISDNWMARVEEVIGYCMDEDLYVIVNDHWDNGWLENDIPNGYNDAKAATLNKMWTQIANRLEHFDQHVMFAGLNEPNAENQAQTNTLMKYEQVFVDAVRATGGNNSERILVIQGPSTNIERTIKYFSMPADEVADRMMLEVHYYDPYNFCLMEKDESWGNTFWFWGKDNHLSGSSHNSTWGEEDYVANTLKGIWDKFHIPTVLGEYAPCMVRSGLTDEELALHRKSRCYWSEVVTREAKNYGLIPFYWDTPNGLFRRSDGKILDQDMIDSVMLGASQGTYPF